MKKLILILMLCLLPAGAWGAVYYVHSGGSDTSPYDTTAKAATQLETVFENIDLGGGDIIQFLSDITEGGAADPVDIPAADSGSDGDPLIIDLGDYRLSTFHTDTLQDLFHHAANANYILMRNGTLRGSDNSGIIYTEVTVTGHTYKNVRFEGFDSSSMVFGLEYFANDAAETISAIVVEECVFALGTGTAISVTGDVEYIAENCVIFWSNAAGASRSGFYLDDHVATSSPQAVISNVTLSGGQLGVYLRPGIDPTSTTIRNCVFASFTVGGILDLSGGATDPDSDYNCFFDNVDDVINCSKGANSLTVDPLLVNAAGGDARGFELKAGSPCCGAGADLSGTFTIDYNGSTRSRWDIGAFTCPSYWENIQRFFGFF